MLASIPRCSAPAIPQWVAERHHHWTLLNVTNPLRPTTSTADMLAAGYLQRETSLVNH